MTVGRKTKVYGISVSPWILPCREELVSSEDLLQWLRPFCADDSLPVRPRIHVLQILGQSFHLTEEDSKLLVFFRTEAILKAMWPQRQVRESVLDISSINYDSGDSLII